MSRFSAVAGRPATGNEEGWGRPSRLRAVAGANIVFAVVLLAVGASSIRGAEPSSMKTPTAAGHHAVESDRKSQAGPAKVRASRHYPLHTGIVSTTFWVGEIFDSSAADGSQAYSTYDSRWQENYGGCDGVTRSGVCSTETRYASNGYFPTAMKPRQNAFYLDLPFDDVNDPQANSTRQSVIPWAHDRAYAGYGTDQSLSLMKNRWVKISANGRNCYGQIEDAGPGHYHDAAYVFGTTNARPSNRDFNGAGLDVSPALNGCLRFSELDGENDRVDWRFVEAADVPAGPWRTVITSSGVQ